VKCLLDNAFAPLTFGGGFLEVPFDRVGEAFFSWVKTFAPSAKKRDVTAALPEALDLMPPLTTGRTRILLLSAGPTWTAYFDNTTRGPDPTGAVGHMSRTLKCRGLVTGCHPEVRKEGRVTNTSAVRFELWGPEQTDGLNLVRHVGVFNDYGRWSFEFGGTPLPFETPEKYKARRVRDRFTPAMLEDYAAALGIRLFDADFYGPEGMLIQLPRPKRFRKMSLKKAQKHHGLR